MVNMVYAAWWYTLEMWARAGAPVLGVVVVWRVGE
jgi:hypothetical protein